MTQKLLLNDIHIGVQRVGGTTPASAQLLKDYLLNRFEEIIFGHPDKDLVINGDVFDAFNIWLADALDFYTIVRAWLLATKRWVFLGMGNHDFSKDSAKLSTFHFICRILQAEFEGRVIVVDKPQLIDQRIYMIPHVPNQDLFDLELSRVPQGGGLLLLHANWNNHFVMESDHSLNVSEKQSKALVAKGWTLVFGHEHQARRPMEGVIVCGNQWPSSVADCLNNPGDKKYAHIIEPDLSLTPIPTWAAEDDLAYVDWRELAGYSGSARFVRVAGAASAEEAPEVIKAISEFRRASDAFVVTNAVAIEGVRDMDDLPASAEQIKSFDVLSYLFEQLSDEQAAAVKKLLADAEPAQLKEAA